MCRGLDQRQELGEDGGICVTLQGFIGLHVESRHQDCAVSCLPQEGLIAASLDGEVLQRCEPA